MCKLFYRAKRVTLSLPETPKSAKMGALVGTPRLWVGSHIKLLKERLTSGPNRQDQVSLGDGAKAGLYLGESYG